MRELREAWCDWMSGRQRGNFYKMLGSSGDGGRTGRVGRDNTSNSKSTVNCFICGEAGHRAVDCKANRPISPNVDRVSGSVSQARQPTCYNCHKEGHKSPDCPLKKVGMTVKKEPLGGGLAPVNVESKGKEVVPKSMVAEGAENFGEILISGVCGETNLRKCTRAMFEVTGLKLEKRVVVDERDDGYCIVPLDLRVDEEVEAFREAVKPKSVNMLTRSQAKREAGLDTVIVGVKTKDLKLGEKEVSVGGESSDNVWSVIEEVSAVEESEQDASVAEEITSVVESGYFGKRCGSTYCIRGPSTFRGKGKAVV